MVVDFAGDEMRKYSILGISLTDHSAREGVRIAEGFLNSGVLNTAACLTSQALAQVAQDEERKLLLEATDLTFCAEPDILEAADLAGAGRVREIEHQIFLRLLLRRLARRQDSVYLLGGTVEQAEALREALVTEQEDLHLVGCSGYEEFDSRPERLMNALNESAPRVILSRMTWPEDLDLMHEGRRYLNAEMWLALSEKSFPGKPRQSVLETIRKKIFRKKVNEYNEEKAAR